MNYVPIFIMDMILLAITVLLAVADRYLVNYGECKVTVVQEDEKKEFVVQGGRQLMAALQENNIEVTSSCGGKSTCGYCKVRVSSGGGQALPTEEIFMSREEKLAGTRLSCQVKVKDDIQIYIPDYLETVKQIVKNRTFDPSRRSTFKIANQTYPELGENRVREKILGEDKTKVDGIIQEHRDKKNALFLILQTINTDYGYLPEHVMFYISRELSAPLSTVYQISTFYNAFSLAPKAKNIVTVCMGTSCYVKGGGRILQALENRLKIKVGENTKDLIFRLETVNCIGCCGQSPVMSVNDDIYGYLKLEMVDNILKKYS